MLKKAIFFAVTAFFLQGVAVATSSDQGSIGGMGNSPMIMQQSKEDLAERFKSIDKSGDGYLDWDEFSAAYPGMRKPAFEAMDANKDGKISQEEWLEFRTRHSKENAGMPKPSESMTPPPGAMEKAQKRGGSMGGMPMMISPPNAEGGQGGLIMPPPGYKSGATQDDATAGSAKTGESKAVESGLEGQPSHNPNKEMPLIEPPKKP